MERFDEFDHCVINVNDLALTYRFYSTVLGEILGGCDTGDITLLTTDEIIHARQSNQRRLSIEGHGGSVAAPHGGVKFGEALVPLFLNQDHVQEPPPEQLRGSPRLGFPVTPEQMERALGVLTRHGVPFEGPIDYPPPCPAARSLYFKDPSSNFIELSVPRGAPNGQGAALSKEGSS